MDLRSVFFFTPIRAKSSAQSVYNPRVKGEYILQGNEGLFFEKAFDNFIDAFLEGKDQQTLSDARFRIIRKSTGKTLREFD